MACQLHLEFLMLSPGIKARLKRLSLTLAIALVTQIGAPRFVFANKCAQNFSREAFKQGWQASDSPLFMSIRGNARHYWEWSLTQLDRIPVNLLAIGVITGDPHIGNFADLLINGKRRFRLIDLDDNGRGPFIFDFVKFVVATRSQRLGISTSELFDSYKTGLSGEKQKKPDFLEVALNQSKKQEEKKQKKFLKKMTSGDSFIFDGNTDFRRLADSDIVIKQMYQAAFSTFREALRGFEVLDTAVTIKKTGGTLLPRFWFFVEGSKDHERQLIEFKQVGDTALSALSKQQNYETRVEQAFDIYWKGERDPHFRAIQVGGTNYFMRPGYKGTLKFDGINKDSEKKEAREMVLYIAYYMGRMVARQESASNYIDTIVGNHKEVLKILETLADDYLALVKSLSK